jgi:hypothetical protein
MSSLVCFWSSVNPSSGNIWHAINIIIAWTEPKLIPTSLAMLRRSLLLSHMTRSCTASKVSSLVASFGRPGRSSSQMFSLPLLIQQPIFHSAIGKGLLPKCFHEVFMDFLGGGYLMTALISTFSIWSKWHTPVLIKVCFCYLICVKPRVTCSLILTRYWYRRIVWKCQCSGYSISGRELLIILCIP